MNLMDLMDLMDLITIMDLMDLPMLINQVIIHGISGLEHEWIMTFHSVGNVIIPTDELHHFSEG